MTADLTLTSSTKPPTIKPQTCPAMAAAGLGTDYVYAFGIVRPTFPSKDVEAQFQAMAQQQGVSHNDFYPMLAPTKSTQHYPPQPHYELANTLCWLLEINNEPLYYLKPRSWVEMQALIETQTTPDNPQYSLVIGSQGPLSPPQWCHGLQLPLVWITKLYHGHPIDLVTRLVPQMKKVLESRGISITEGKEELMRDIVLTLLSALEFRPNRGNSDPDRALNYLAFANVDMYLKHYEMTNTKQIASNQQTSNSPTPTSNQVDRFYLLRVKTETTTVGERRIVDVIFVYQKYITDEQLAFYCSIDVTGQFPFIKTPLRPYMQQPAGENVH